MFDRKDIAQLKKDIVLDVELLNSRFKLHTRWGVFSPRSIDDGTLLLMKYISANENDIGGFLAPDRLMMVRFF